MRQEPQTSFPSSIVLAFSAIDEHATINDFRFEETLSVFDGLTLQTLRKLSIERKALHPHARAPGADLDALERKCVCDTRRVNTCNTHHIRLEQYIGSMDSYMDKARCVYPVPRNTHASRCLARWHPPRNNESSLSTTPPCRNQHTAPCTP